jgi:hypothetical protein
MYRLTFFFLLFPLNIHAQSIHQKITDEIAIRTEAGQNALMHELVRYSLLHPQTKRATFDEAMSTITITPRVSSEMLRNFEVRSLLKQLLKSNGQFCGTPFIKALTENGLTFAIQLDLPDDMPDNTINEIRFMPYTKELVRQNPAWEDIGKPLDANFWCVDYLSKTVDFNKTLSLRSIHPFTGYYWYKHEQLSQECINKIGRKLNRDHGITTGMRQTALVREKINEARSNIYSNCGKGIVKFTWDYLKNIFN